MECYWNKSVSRVGGWVWLGQCCDLPLSFRAAPKVFGPPEEGGGKKKKNSVSFSRIIVPFIMDTD